MLGKGLESLIPNKGSSPSGLPSDGISPKLTTPPPEEELPAGHEHEGGPLILSVFPGEPMVVSTPISTPAPVAVAPAVPVRHSDASSKHSDAIFHIEVEKIRPNPHQPRRTFDEQALKDLAASIREFGILQPIVVRKIERDIPSGTEIEYELIAGERRLMAAKMIGLERVPAIIKRVDVERERLEMAVIENLQREDLNPLEMARAYARLQDEFRMTQREIATRLGKSREVIANTLRLLDLPLDVQQAIERGHISESHGRLLLAVEDPSARRALFNDLLASHMTTRELKDRLRSLTTKKKQSAQHVPIPDAMLSPEVTEMQERLSSQLGTPVKISQSGETGKITITFYSQEELEHILKKFGERD